MVLRVRHWLFIVAAAVSAPRAAVSEATPLIQTACKGAAVTAFVAAGGSQCFVRRMHGSETDKMRHHPVLWEPLAVGDAVECTAVHAVLVITNCEGRESKSITLKDMRNGSYIVPSVSPSEPDDAATKGAARTASTFTGSPFDFHVAALGMDIHHGLDGSRRVLVERPDHSRVLAERGGRGYVQRPYVLGGHEFEQRTYWDRAEAYARFYVRELYDGFSLDVYAPVDYYPIQFYSWAKNSWQTDHLLDLNLQAAGGASATLTADVKQQIAAEVRSQIDEERKAAHALAGDARVVPAYTGLPALLSDGAPHVLVAASDIDVYDALGGACALMQGDVIQLQGPIAPSEGKVNATVLAAVPGNKSCEPETRVAVALTDLQDMQNHMRETVDLGLKELRSKYSDGEIPVVMADFAVSAPPLVANVGEQIVAQERAADRIDQDAAAVATEIDALKAIPTERGMLLTLDDFMFDPGKVALNPRAFHKLDELAQFLIAHPDRRVKVNGFTDSVGSDGYNQDLSERRAIAVKTALLVRGVDGSRVAAQGHGREFPVASNADAGGRQLNRRVEIVIEREEASP